MALPPDFVRPINHVGPVSSIGIGTYMGDCDDMDDAQHRTALARALDLGVTLIDTAINYRCQRAERVVGDVLRARPADGRPTPVICTKGGYLPLDNMPPADKASYREYVQQQYIDTGIIEECDLVAGGHCIAPTFLLDQIRRSRTNLGIQTIDLYYVHNPEQQLSGVSRVEFERRLTAAFETLERSVADGTIRAYGCATWHGFRTSPQAANALQLETVMRVAAEVGGPAHHLAAVQLPLNLGMPEAMRLANQTVNGVSCTFLQAAHDVGVAVVASAGLMHGQLTHDLPTQLHDIFPTAQTDTQRAIAFARAAPGVTSVLIGMRTPDHIDENLRVVA